MLSRCSAGLLPHACAELPRAPKRPPPPSLPPSQIPESLARKVGEDLSYQDVVHYQPDLLRQPPYTLLVNSVSPMLGDKVCVLEPTWEQRRRRLQLVLPEGRACPGRCLLIYCLTPCRAASPAAQSWSRWAPTAAATRWSRRSSE